MTGALVSPCVRLVGLALLGLVGVVPSSSADPVRVTAGFFISPEDGPPGYSLEGDGLLLSAFFPLVTASPRDVCLAGCLPGITVDMRTVAGGESASTPFTLGTSPGALINGTEFGDLGQFGPMLGLAGVLRFDAPSVVLPPFESYDPLQVPFAFTASVTGFAADDLAASAPLFNVSLMGQGTATLEFLEGIGGSYFEPYVTYTFSAAADPVPEPGTLLLLGTGLAVGARRFRTRKHRRARAISA